ncbi:MAG: hypothetical protein NTX25_13950, partial [Proteobacteria bacterium]|nr:hypothetical protein [Pseudomonadota bacterium]
MMCRINRLSHPGKILLIALALVISSCSGDMKVTTVANYQKYKNTPLGVEVIKLSSSDTQDGCYGEGSIITLDMELSDALTVDDPSTLSIPLVLGESIRQANYSSGNGSAVFHFVYQVAAGDNSPRLQYAEGASLTLTPLAIAGKNLVQAKIQPKSLTLPATTALESLGSLKKIIIDTTAPKLPSGLAFSKSQAAQGDDPILTWSASDDANFKDYELKLCAKDDCESSCTTLQRISSSEAHFSGFVDGSYHACVRAWDHALNSSAFAASAGKIELDRTAPEAPSSVVFDKAYYSGSAAKISFNPSKDLDLDFYRAKICRQADCQNQCAGEQTLKKLTAEFSLQEAQPVFACVQAVDKAGNVSAWTASLQTALSDSQAPLIDLGVARRAGTSFTLRPSVTDASPLSYAWTQVSGPGSIQFESATAKDTLIAADQEGVYQLKLTVSDATGHSSSAQVQLSWDRSLVLSLGRHDSCAIYPRGELRCWGRNNIGQLGYNSIKMIPTIPSAAVNLGTGRSALSVSVGGFHTCAILDDSSIKCWGLNTSGELGYGDSLVRYVPDSAAVQLGSGRKALAVSTGFNHTCAVLDNGTVKCWGGNSSGQLGYGDTTNRFSPPEQSLDLGAGRTALAISTSQDSSCALLDNGSVKCWGANTYGQLGYGDTTQRLSPSSLAIDFGASLTVKSLPRAGRYYFCAILSDDTARCWGNNGSGALGDGTSTNRSTPVALQSSLYGNPKQLALGGSGSCALFAGGTVSCWGD